MSEDTTTQAAEEETEETTEDSTEEKTKKTVLYCKTRAALTAEDLTSIKSALEEEGYCLTPSEEGDKVMIQREEVEDKSDVLSEVLG